MEKIGVEMLVSGLSGFMDDLGKADKGIQGLVPGAGLLGSTLSTLGDIATSVGGWIANVLAVAIGNILADAVEWATSQLAEMVSMAIEAGEQFQSLEIRLNQMNFNKATESTDDYTAAMETAVKMTQEQLAWIQKLAVSTPFEVTDIANVYSLARSYDFADQDARDLTETISDFASGMGLGSVEIERIIKNFGQMQQQGKVTQREMNDLARGAFVPVNDILAEMQKQTGLTGKAFDDFRNSAEGVDMFMEKFAELVDTKFAGASQKAARTLKAATLNLKEFFASFAASEVVKPVFDLLGGRIADLNDSLTERLPEIIEGWSRIGDVVVEILGEILDLAPSADEMADGLIGALNGIADWLTSHKQDIIDFFKGGYDFITGTLIPKLMELKDWFFGVAPIEMRTQETTTDESGMSTTTFSTEQFGGQEGALQKIIGYIKEMQPLLAPIQQLFGAIGEVIMQIAQDAGLFVDDMSDKTFAETVQAAADGIGKLATWISENKESIAYWIEKFVIGTVALAAFAAAGAIVVGIVKDLITTFVGWMIENQNWLKVAFVLVAIAAIIGLVMSGIGIGIILVGVAIVALGIILAENWESIKAWAANTWNTFTEWVSGVVTAINDWDVKTGDQFRNWVARIGTQIDTWKNNTISAISDWANQTIAKVIEWTTGFVEKVNELRQKIIDKFQELKNGIVAKLTEIRNTIKEKISSAVNSIKEIDLYSIGIGLMKSLASGIVSGISSVVDAIQNAASQAQSALNDALDMHSPSRVMIRAGLDIDKGLAMGIKNYAGLVSDAMNSMANMAMSPLSTMPSMATAAANSNVTTNNTNNYNLSINSNAKSEPIIQGFAMLRSLG